MGNHGKKVGKVSVSPVRARYALDVRLDMEANQFVILVPRNPGEAVNTKLGRGVNYDMFTDPALGEAKRKAKEFLKSRDVTEFEDVIEYNHFGSERSHHYREVDNSVGFEFRVARVSCAKDGHGRPKLEISVDADDAGCITVSDWVGQPVIPEAHRSEYDSSIPFTVERWRKCCGIRDGIAAIGKMMTELFSKGSDEAATRLDTLRTNMPLLLTSPSDKADRCKMLPSKVTVSLVKNCDTHGSCSRILKPLGESVAGILLHLGFKVVVTPTPIMDIEISW